ncbi:MAG: helix-turn-helix domain-containing protein [Treponema sp.]|nr:helix-turn-helix domain-containing protein [Treponema sp.]
MNGKDSKPKFDDSNEKYLRNLFITNLRKLRNDRQMSQQELASYANLSINFVNELENGRKFPSIETLSKLVQALSIDLFRLFTPETMMEIDNADIFKAELTELITTVVSEKVDRYIVKENKNEPEIRKPRT